MARRRRTITGLIKQFFVGGRRHGSLELYGRRNRTEHRVDAFRGKARKRRRRR